MKNIIKNVFLILIILFCNNSFSKVDYKKIFISLDIPENYKVSNIQKFTKSLLEDYNFKEEKLPHTTLLFLDKVDASKTQNIINAIQKTINKFCNVNLSGDLHTLHTCGFQQIGELTLKPGAHIFGKNKNVIVLVYKDDNEINTLKCFIQNLLFELSKVGIITKQFARNIYNRFEPHITLGRINTHLIKDNKKFAQLLEEINPPKNVLTQKNSFTPKTITLYESKNGKFVPIKTFLIYHYKI